MLKKDIYLITGGCGFIGSAVIRHLLKDKNNIVINIDKLSYASNTDAVEASESESYIFIKDDIINKEKINEILINYSPNYVIHLAAESHVDRSIDNPISFIESNILGTFNLLHECYSYWKNLENKPKDKFKFLFVSTDEVYGSTSDESFSELSPLRPNSPYAASKASADLLARSWFKTYNFPIIVSNCSNNYGKWQYPEKLIPLVIKKCIQNKKIPIYGNGKHERDWLHVDDHVNGLLSLLYRGSIGQKYNIASSKEKSNLDVVIEICKIMDDLKPNSSNSYSELISFVKDRPGHDFRYSINTDKILDELGWYPTIEFSDGLRETIIWYLENQDWLFDPDRISYNGDRLGHLIE